MTRPVIIILLFYSLKLVFYVTFTCINNFMYSTTIIASDVFLIDITFFINKGNSSIVIVITNTTISHYSVGSSFFGSSGSVRGNAATTTRMETRREVRMTFTGTLSGSGTLEYDGTSETNMTAQIETILADATIDGLTPLPE